MKILITMDSDVQRDINGIVTTARMLCRQLEARGHEVRFLCLSGRGKGYTDGKVTYISALPAEFVYPDIRFRFGAASTRELRGILEWRPDLVHSQNETSTLASAKKIARRLDIPLIQTHHTCWQDYMRYMHVGRRLGDWVVRNYYRYIVSRYCVYIIAPTPKVARLTESYRLFCPTVLLPSGVDLARFDRPLPPAQARALRKKWQLPTGPLALHLGRMAAEKNVEELLTLWQKMEIPLLIVGGGPCLPALREQAHRAGLDGKVFFTGMVPFEETWKYYQLADLFVCASTTETQGMTYCEAAASGLPLLCRADPCLEDLLVEGVNGWAYRTPEEFYAKAALALAAPPDRAAVAAVAAEKLSQERFGDRIVRLYEQALRIHGKEENAYDY